MMTIAPSSEGTSRNVPEVAFIIPHQTIAQTTDVRTYLFISHQIVRCSFLSGDRINQLIEKQKRHLDEVLIRARFKIH